jgi:hypothetical protein
VATSDSKKGQTGDWSRAVRTKQVACDVGAFVANLRLTLSPCPTLDCAFAQPLLPRLALSKLA